MRGKCSLLGGMDCFPVNGPGFLAGTDAKIIEKPLAKAFINGRSTFLVPVGSQFFHQNLIERFMVRLCGDAPAAEMSRFLVPVLPGQQIGSFQGQHHEQIVKMRGHGNDPAFGGLPFQKIAPV